MKKNRRHLLTLQFFASLGSAFVGVFLPFLVLRAFELTLPQVLLWTAAAMVSCGLFVFPLNYFLGNRWGPKRMVQVGLGFHALFLALLGGGWTDPGWLILGMILWVLYLTLFWPSYHLLILQSTQLSQRGTFFGNFQFLLVGASLLAPILSGFLLEAGLREWISLVSAVCFVAAIIFTQQIEVSSQKLISFSASWRFFRRHFLSLQRRGGFLADAVQTGTLLYVWPIFFHFVVGSFTLMGIFVSAAAVAEMISTQFFGRFVDRKSPQRSLRWAAVARAFDIGIRGGLLWVPHVAMVAVVQGVSGILGPLFNIAFYTRVSEMAEKDSSKSLTFYVTREWSLAVGRTLVLLFSAFLVWMGGAEMLVVSLFLAAVFSAWFRRF